MHFKNNFEDYISALTPKVARRVRDMETASQIFLFDKYGYLPSAGEIKMPVLKPYNGDIPQKLVAFHEAYSKCVTEATIHFFIADSLFTRIFRNPEKYLPFLKECKAVIGPDLSQYADMPLDMRYQHSLCNMLFMSLMQSYGISVIPNITWSLRDSYSFSFPPELENSIIAINSNGVNQSNLSKYLWTNGYEEARRILHPSHIIRYGFRVNGEEQANCTYFINERLNLLRNGRKW